MNEFGKMLRQARTAAGISMGKLARHLEVSVTYVSDVELGKRAPLVVEKIRRAAELIGADAEPLERAATKVRRQYVLQGQNVSPTAQATGAALARGWAEMSDETLDRIRQLVEEEERTRELKARTGKDHDE